MPERLNDRWENLNLNLQIQKYNQYIQKYKNKTKTDAREVEYVAQFNTLVRGP